MNDAAALEVLQGLLDKGWRCEIHGGGLLRWEVELVGRGLANRRGCGGTFGEAAEAAIKGATGMEDDPFVVLGRSAVPLLRLLQECFGKDAPLNLGPVPSEHEFGPHVILVEIKPKEGMTPQEYVDLEADFYEKARNTLPEELWRAIRMTARWPEETEPGRRPGAENPEPARSADEHLSIAGILAKGIELMGSGWVQREVPAGGSAAVITRTPAGFKARIPAALIGIPLGEIDDVGGLVLVEQDANGDYLIRMSDPGLPGEAQTEEIRRKVREHLDCPPRSGGAGFSDAPLGSRARTGMRLAKTGLSDAHEEDPARSADGPMLPRLLGEAIAEIINRPGGSALTDSEVLASLDPSLFEGSSGDEIGRFIEEMRRLAWKREVSTRSGAGTTGSPTLDRTLQKRSERGDGRMEDISSPAHEEDPARSAGARLSGPMADCPICRTNPMPAHEEDPSRRLAAKNSWDRATHERLTAAVDDLVRGASTGAETDEEITGHLPTDALVAMDPQAIGDLIAWVRSARGTPGPAKDPARSARGDFPPDEGTRPASPMTGDPARSAAPASPIEGGPGGDAAAPGARMTRDPSRRLDAGNRIAPRAEASILGTTPPDFPSAADAPDAASEVPAREENKEGHEDYVAARTLCSAVEAFLRSIADGGRDAFNIERLRAAFDLTQSAIRRGGR